MKLMEKYKSKFRSPQKIPSMESGLQKGRDSCLLHEWVSFSCRAASFISWKFQQCAQQQLTSNKNNAQQQLTSNRKLKILKKKYFNKLKCFFKVLDVLMVYYSSSDWQRIITMCFTDLKCKSDLPSMVSWLTARKVYWYIHTAGEWAQA